MLNIECLSFLAGKVPDFSKKPENASGPVGGDAEFKVKVDGEPKPTVKW